MPRVLVTKGTKLLKIGPSCQKLDVSPWTLRRYVKQGLIPAGIALVPGGPRAWREEDLDNFIAKRASARSPRRGLSPACAEGLAKHQATAAQAKRGRT